MIREIEFQVWDKGKMHNVQRLIWSGLTDEMFAYDDGGSDVLLNATNLRQYTGLKDKKGVKVYEGDILRHDLWRIPVKVFWEYGSFMCQSVTGELGKKSYTDGTLYDMQLPKCKVIGNIYENPELLK